MTNFDRQFWFDTIVWIATCAALCAYALWLAS
jgi:hypothetical protein